MRPPKFGEQPGRPGRMGSRDDWRAYAMQLERTIRKAMGMLREQVKKQAPAIRRRGSDEICGTCKHYDWIPDGRCLHPQNRVFEEPQQVGISDWCHFFERDK